MIGFEPRQQLYPTGYHRQKLISASYLRDIAQWQGTLRLSKSRRLQRHPSCALPSAVGPIDRLAIRGSSFVQSRLRASFHCPQAELALSDRDDLRH